MAQILVETSELQILIAEVVEKSVTTAIKKANTKEWMTSREVRELTGFSPSKLQHLRRSNQLEFVQHSKSIVYATDSVYSWLEKRRIKKTS